MFAITSLLHTAFTATGENLSMYLLRSSAAHIHGALQGSLLVELGSTAKDLLAFLRDLRLLTQLPYFCQHAVRAQQQKR